jgi:ZIP family zinc transporter
MDEPGALAVFAAAPATAVATGLGAGPFLFVAHIARSWIGVASALAAGFVVAASALLFYEGAHEGPR